MILETTDVIKTAKKEGLKKYMIVYLFLTFGICWAFAFLYGTQPQLMKELFGELDLNSPVALIILNMPSVAGILMYLWYGGLDGMLKFLRTTIPMKKDLKWFPILFGIMFAYIFLVRYFCIVFGLPVPEMTQSIGENTRIFLTNFYMELGMLGSAWGWYGFFFPFLQKYIKNNVVCGMITGLALGLYLAPGFDFSTPENTIGYFIYVLSFIIYSAWLSYILNDTNNNVSFFIASFWVMATGSKMQFYYFVPKTQVIQIALFLILWFFIHLYFKSANKGKTKDEILQVFPEFIEARGPLVSLPGKAETA